ncbi:MAG TPA: hypothetical protein PKH77_21230 [Anaerolineae bacterium]|nr:hypothetical protein [Anaerolineae bacterium]
MRESERARERESGSADQRISGSANYELRFTFHVLLSFLLLTSYFLLLTPVFAQSSPDVIALWESDVPPEGGWTVGDPLALRLRVIASEGVGVTLPALPETWGDFEVREQAAQPSETKAGKTTTLLAATVALWSPGDHETPPITVTYQTADGAVHEITATPLTVSIASVLAEATPNAEGQIEKRDLKPQATLPRPPLWPWIVGGLVALPLLYFAGRWLWQRLPRLAHAAAEAVPEPVDTRPPDVIAYEELDRIAALDLPTQGAFKAHYTLLTDCVRAYAGRVYAIPALDSTTFELLAALRGASLKGEPFNVLRDLLDESDLVKFAKFTPDLEPARAAIAQARHFVDITKPSEELGVAS